MAEDNQTSTRSFIRGGQVMLHNYRMMKQIVDRVAVFSFLVFFIVTIGITYNKIDGFHTFAIKHWGTARAFTFFNANATQKMVVPKSSGIGIENLTVYSSQVLNDQRITRALKEVGDIVVLSMLYGVLSSITFLMFVFIFLKRRGKKQSETKKLRGYDIAEPKQINALLEKSGRSDIKLGDLYMPKNFEAGHVLIHGTTGMGKSVCIKELLDQIRKRGDKAIIYDQGCDYIGSFYQESDVILNPLDNRTASWYLWDECRDSADYDSLAASLISSSSEYGDQFWVNSARTVFAAIAKKMENGESRKIPHLLKLSLVSELSILEDYLKGTEAASLISEKSDKTSLSIRATLATYIKGLSYIKEDGDRFSIRSWIQDDENKNWLFISSLADRHETLKPLISMWLDLAANSLMSLSPSHNRRIWLIFDELASLHKLPYLPNAFAQSRKFGGCIVVGIQSISQLSKVYGPNAANEISNMCNTRVFFRSPSNEGAVWTSKELGQHEVEEMKEGISYSESAMRSGISIAKQTMQKDLVNPAEIMQLPALEAYMRLSGELPITKIKLKYKNRDTRAPGFITRKIEKKSHYSE